jgi:hypothetical protein
MGPPPAGRLGAPQPGAAGVAAEVAGRGPWDGQGLLQQGNGGVCGGGCRAWRGRPSGKRDEQRSKARAGVRFRRFTPVTPPPCPSGPGRRGRSHAAVEQCWPGPPPGARRAPLSRRGGMTPGSDRCVSHSRAMVAAPQIAMSRLIHQGRPRSLWGGPGRARAGAGLAVSLGCARPLLEPRRGGRARRRRGARALRVGVVPWDS